MIQIPANVWSESKFYSGSINQIRGAVGETKEWAVSRRNGNTVRARVTPTISTTRQYAMDDFIKVRFADPYLTVLLRKDDLYIIGWYNDKIAVDAQNGKGDDPISANRMAPEKMWPNNVTKEISPQSLNYEQLCPEAMAKGTLLVGPQQLKNALTELTVKDGKLKEKARGLCTVVVMIAEAARFHSVLKKITDNWLDSDKKLELGLREADSVKKWAKMAKFTFWENGKQSQEFARDYYPIGTNDEKYNRYNRIENNNKYVTVEKVVAVFNGTAKEP